jgi:cytochrome c-type biogenesis protein CcmE
MIKTKSNFHFVFLLGLFFVIVGSVIVLVTTQTSSSVLTPSEVIEKINKAGERYGSLYRVRVAGRVGNQDIQYQVDPTFKLEFFVVDRPDQGPDSVSGTTLGAPGTTLGGAGTASGATSAAPGLKVVFEDVKPDMFANGRDVLIDGNVIDGVLHASALLTQCPSKYEPEDAPSEHPPEK